jgi:YfiH family protein
MIKEQQDEIVYYTFNSLAKQDKIKHLFSTRVGGVSEGKYASMNLGLGSGDDKENVMENFKRIARLGFPIEKMVLSSQVHETGVRTVTSDDCGKGIIIESDIVRIDGLITDKPEVVLVTFYADCVPLYFFDPVKNVIALSHAGWRGTLLEMGKVTADKMNEEFGSSKKDLLIGIGPSICKNCFEVSNEVSDMFIDKFSYARDFIASLDTASGKSFIDLWGLNKQILTDAGVLEQNIELPGTCTKCNPDIFYSYRAQGTGRGSMAAFLALCGV